MRKDPIDRELKKIDRCGSAATSQARCLLYGVELDPFSSNSFIDECDTFSHLEDCLHMAKKTPKDFYNVLVSKSLIDLSKFLELLGADTRKKGIYNDLYGPMFNSLYEFIKAGKHVGLLMILDFLFKSGYPQTTHGCIIVAGWCLELVPDVTECAELVSNIMDRVGDLSKYVDVAHDTWIDDASNRFLYRDQDQERIQTLSTLPCFQGIFGEIGFEKLVKHKTRSMFLSSILNGDEKPDLEWFKKAVFGIFPGGTVADGDVCMLRDILECIGVRSHLLDQLVWLLAAFQDSRNCRIACRTVENYRNWTGQSLLVVGDYDPPSSEQFLGNKCVKSIFNFLSPDRDPARVLKIRNMRPWLARLLDSEMTNCTLQFADSITEYLALVDSVFEIDDGTVDSRVSLPFLVLNVIIEHSRSYQMGDSGFYLQENDSYF